MLVRFAKKNFGGIKDNTQIARFSFTLHHTHMFDRNFNFARLLLLPIVFIATTAQAYNVTNIKATVRSGQVFLTWNNPGATNLMYKVYRSASKINSKSQLTSANFVGYVRDNSAKNIRKSTLQNQDFYFIIDPANGPLASKKGLYVYTCSNSKQYYYAVMVLNLSTGIESKNIYVGCNSLSDPVSEHKGTPQPILQNTVNEPNGDINYEYTIWGGNQELSSYPAFNNCGSYGYDFTFISRNPGISGPLYIKFDDDDPFQMMGESTCSECNILELDDWLPNGNTTYWVGYNTNYDIYSTTNPVQTTGVVRTYTQNLLKKIITWASTEPNVDATRVYASGWSHNGYGAMFTSTMIPDQIAATQMNVSPCLIKAGIGSDRETQWCQNSLNLKSDVTDPNTGDTLLIWNLLDLRKTFYREMKQNLPFMSGVNGKKDVTVGWVQSYHWFDSLNFDRLGGIWYWDQRNHQGSGSNFTSDETNLDFLRFSTTKSYPAFAYCSINQNPGNGNANNGDQYGAINGYLDWDDSSIIDQKCSYSIDCFVKDFYVGGVIQTQYDSCIRDVTLRRLQNFKPADGQLISWSVTKSNNAIVQSGSFIYTSSSPITVYAAKIYRSGSILSFTIDNCQKDGNSELISAPSPLMILARRENGYEVTVNLNVASEAEVNVIDMMGRIVGSQKISTHEGSNTFFIPLNTSGAYVLQMKSAGFSESRKLVF